MGKKEKLVNRFKSKPKDFAWDELIAMLRGFGYELAKGKKTGGSRARFTHKKLPPITLYKPHSPAALRPYQIEQIAEFLREEGLL